MAKAHRTQFDANFFKFQEQINPPKIENFSIDKSG